MQDITKTIDKIHNILKEQKFAVISSIDGESIHSNIVAFVYMKKVEKLFFCTTKSTRKYNNLIQNNTISLLIHNCNNESLDIKKAYSLTIKGEAKELEDTPKSIKNKYLKKHPYLKDLFNSPTSTFFEIEIFSVDLVEHFQEVISIQMREHENTNSK